MTIDTQRRIDRYAGVPLCLLTGAFLRLRRRTGRRAASGTIREICVIKFFGIGSIVLTGPLLALLRASYPDARITYLTFTRNASAPALFPSVDRVLTISTGTGFLRDTLRVLRSLRGCDIVLDLEFFSKFSTLLSALSGASRRTGFDLPTRWRRWNLTDNIPLDRSEHVSSMFLRHLQVLGLPQTGDHPLPVLSPTSSDREGCFRKLRLRANAMPILVVNVNADETSHERRWRPERFAAVIDRVTAEWPDIRVLLTGTAGERAYIEQVRRRCSAPVLNVAGDLTLGEFAALLEASTALLSNDSGPVHLAAAAGTPSVSLYGPEAPAFYGPLDGSATIYAATECSPCLNIYAAKRFVCPYRARCMEAITVEEVTETLLGLLRREMAHAIVA